VSVTNLYAQVPVQLDQAVGLCTLKGSADIAQRVNHRVHLGGLKTRRRRNGLDLGVRRLPLGLRRR
jgi:hypothetical protein